jgi:hypothetical protein
VLNLTETIHELEYLDGNEPLTRLSRNFPKTFKVFILSKQKAIFVLDDLSVAIEPTMWILSAYVIFNFSLEK